MLETFPSQLGKGGSNLTDGKLAALVKESLGRKTTLVAGAANGTKMDIAAMRLEDTLISVISSNDAAAGVLTDVTANCTIEDTRAKGTITVSGNPLNNDTVTVNGVVFTWKTAGTQTDAKHVPITPGDNTAMALALSNAINAYENRRKVSTPTGGTPTEEPNTPVLVASSNAGVVTVTSVKEGPGNPVTVTSSGATVAVAGSGSASATVTCATAVNGNTVSITDQNGVVKVFTIRTTADATNYQDVQLGADNTIMAANIAKAVNRYEEYYGSLGVRATSALAVVTLVPRDPIYGNLIPLVEASTNVVVSGANLAGGTNTGGFKCTTTLVNRSVMVTWADKNP